MSHATRHWLILATRLARGVAPVHAVDKAHENDVHGAATLKLDNGQKWKTYGEFFDHRGWTESAAKHEH